MENELVEKYLWVEKYRPKTIDDCILPVDIQKVFKEIVSSRTLPNLLLSGSAGTGKTTVARALCQELDYTYMFINASEESGIDVLRTKIRHFASTVSLNGGNKVVILDEADNLTVATQSALRSFIEEFSSNCRFILTCNFKNRLIEPLHSRLVNVDFIIRSGEKKDIAKKVLIRLAHILSSEKVKYDKDVILGLVKKYFPDFRKMINELQRFSISGEISKDVLTDLNQSRMDDLVKSMKDRKFMDVRKWVVENIDNDPSRLYRMLYDHFYDSLKPESIPASILILHDYQYKSGFVADREINILSCLVEIMSQCQFKE